MSQPLPAKPPQASQPLPAKPPQASQPLPVKPPQVSQPLPAKPPPTKQAAPAKQAGPAQAGPAKAGPAKQPGQAKAPQRPAAQEAASAQATTAQARPAKSPDSAAAPPKGRRPATLEERLTMTDEMEPIDDSTKVRRKIDNTLARFSAAHDELAEEEAKRRQRVERFTARPAQLIEQTRTRLQRIVTPRELAREADAEAAELTRAVAEPEEPATPQTRLQEKKERRIQRSVQIGRIIAAVLAALIFLGLGTAWGAKTWFNSKFTQVSALDENSADIKDASAQNGDENFLLVGSDTRAGATNDENVGSASEVQGARSDTVMLAHLPADRSGAMVISFPRDLEISRPACNRFDSGKNDYTDEVVAAEKQVKLNTAYAVGGPRCLTRWMQQLTGLKINHFVGIDFSGFKDMVDAVQGVTVHVDKPIDDSVLGWVISQTGDVTISGDQALSFVRARHVIGDPTSDYGRIKRQQEFIKALMQKAMSHGVLTNPSQLSAFVTAFAKATFGDNIGIDQMLTLAQSMKGLDATKVNFTTVPTTGVANSRGNEVLVDSKADAIFQSLIDNTSLPAGTAPASPSTPNTASSSGGTGSIQPAEEG
ncbi:MAG TPA: LCP family protein [Amycolatopsis sp.]|nr:LCP family protein [Amycolatopsis sp.]